MDSMVEWSIRRKVADLQIFLASDACTPTALEELDRALDSAVQCVVRAKDTREAECGSS
jgi:hypothetical protein